MIGTKTVIVGEVRSGHCGYINTTRRLSDDLYVACERKRKIKGVSIVFGLDVEG